MMPRTFRAKDMPSALKAIYQALGSEALIVSVRRFPVTRWWRIWRGEKVEVVAVPSVVASPQTTADEAPPGETFWKMLIPLKAKESIKLMDCGKQGNPGAPGAFSVSPVKAWIPETKEPARSAPNIPRFPVELQNRLVAQGVAPVIVESILQAVAGVNALDLGDDRMVCEWVRQQLQVRLRTNGESFLTNQRLICIIGRNGSGKTSLGAKIAAYAARNFGKRVGWITADTLRAGAIAKAQAVTAPLGISLRLAYSPEELAAAANKDMGDDLVVVDTPGCNPYQTGDVAELAALLAALPNHQTLLVAPATAKEADLDQAAAAFSPLGNLSLAISRMDETRTFGGIYNFILRSQLPISCYTLGPRILEDLHPANPAILVDALLGIGMAPPDCTARG